MRFSLVCPVFDTPPLLLREAIWSVLSQDEQRICEIILADDGSRNPDTLNALEEISASDDRLRLLRLDANKGPSSARGAGVRIAQGEWIGFLDSDDLWMQGALQQFCDVIASWPAAQWIAGNYQIRYSAKRSDKNPRISDAIAGTVVAPGLVRLGGATLTRHLLSSFRLHIGGTLVRRSRLIGIKDCGFTEGLFYGDDRLLLVRISTLCDLYFLESETYILRREHESAVMGSTRRLTSEYVAPHFVALRDGNLRAFRRDARWSLYSALKGLALNNLINGRYLIGFGFALRAYMMDPREIGDLARFIGLMASGKNASLDRASRYSNAERFIASPG